jgi:hypothetical protein
LHLPFENDADEDEDEDVHCPLSRAAISVKMSQDQEERSIKTNPEEIQVQTPQSGQASMHESGRNKRKTVSDFGDMNRPAGRSNTSFGNALGESCRLRLTALVLSGTVGVNATGSYEADLGLTPPPFCRPSWQ